MKTKRIGFDVELSTSHDFDKVCEELGTTRSNLARQLMELVADGLIVIKMRNKRITQLEVTKSFPVDPRSVLSKGDERKITNFDVRGQ